ncbi:hypothetical protein GCM10023184_00730 [Flaviaesturariibacter amylovorans]|uniref:SdiA-regulated family protein n=2 Tax=Flaviaesturariibacter amylovorans TaxID=1084520 RepID=A0ABP8G501_9BACT
MALLLLLGGCQMLGSRRTLPGYVLPRPEIHFLEKKLSEISGINYIPSENSLIAITDDKRRVYRVHIDGHADDYFEPEIGPAADYEDVVKVDSSVFVLVSNGALIEARRTDSGVATTTRFLFPPEGVDPAVTSGAAVDAAVEELSKDVDFETLYYDSSARGLILLTKNRKDESKQAIRTAWRFDLAARRFDTVPFYTISFKEVNLRLKDGRTEFKPSAAAIHPIERRLYILSSAGMLLVVTDLRGTVEAVYRLNPSFYPQAEGIAFATNGDMYISNEAKLGKATLLRLPYKTGDKAPAGGARTKPSKPAARSAAP